MTLVLKRKRTIQKRALPSSLLSKLMDRADVKFNNFRIAQTPATIKYSFTGFNGSVFDFTESKEGEFIVGMRDIYGQH